MKKVLAIMALVSVVALASVAHGQATVTVGGTLAAVSSIDLCAATIALDPGSAETDDCVADNYVSNNAGGTTLDYATDGATANLVASGTNTDLSPVTSVTPGNNEWSLKTVASTITGNTPSGSGSAPAIAGVQVLAVAAPTDGGSLTLTFEGSVGSTEDSGESYTNAGTLTITEL